MLNIIWSFIIVSAVVCSLFLGNAADVSSAFADSAADAVTLLLQLAGIISLWSGLMNIAGRSGLTALPARALAPLLRRLFPQLDRDSAAFEAISMNISANLLGLGNTATPLGLKAMQELHALHGGDEACDEMVLFVVMNTASLQLLPTTLGALRQSYGSAAPFEILVPVWLSSAGALAVALTIAVTGNRVAAKRRQRRLP